MWPCKIPWSGETSETPWTSWSDLRELNENHWDEARGKFVASFMVKMGIDCFMASFFHMDILDIGYVEFFHKF